MFATRAVVGPQVSSNWAGYAVTPPAMAGVPAAEPSFTQVTGTWVQPKPTCRAGTATSSAFWVGLGGFDENAQALEQIGTEADCSATGASSHSAWWEIVPAPSVKITLKIVAGDTINAAVLVSGQRVTLSLKNETRHTRFSKVLTATGPLDLSSAEWIAEAPSLCTSSGTCRVVPLTDYGRISFSKASTTGGGHAGTISDPAWVTTPLVLASSLGAFGFRTTASAPGAVPSELSPDGASFSVSWLENLDPTPAG